jgi:hypothetical protein
LNKPNPAGAGGKTYRMNMAISAVVCYICNRRMPPVDNSQIDAENVKPSQRKIELKYTFEMDGGFYVGHLDDYPEFPTQGENLKDFEDNLLDIYEMIQNGTLDVPQKHGVLEITA